MGDWCTLSLSGTCSLRGTCRQHWQRGWGWREPAETARGRAGKNPQKPPAASAVGMQMMNTHRSCQWHWWRQQGWWAPAEAVSAVSSRDRAGEHPQKPPLASAEGMALSRGACAPPPLTSYQSPIFLGMLLKDHHTLFSGTISILPTGIHYKSKNTPPSCWLIKFNVSCFVLSYNGSNIKILI